ncbi:hypothetical protein FUT88_03130 [Ralstonia sp. TCR112]|uniref:beta strand repeat-containing protein n=1 Tax=Ralstonia sp. TCR112 TaxID=2601730 RepID=UPI0011BE33AC|nr:calcium-binding protein [Ralstonia sp. TCR112]TXD63277.1 hypothetical protein FUT88_03130 [Ralstonia sp. TCR112]
MTIIYSAGLDSETYKVRLKTFMRAVEGSEYSPYVDTANPGVPTIGWGFALNNAHAVQAGRNFIYTTVLGIDPSRIVVPLDHSAPQYAAQKADRDKEKYYQDRLTAVLNQYWSPDNTIQHLGSSVQLVSALNAVLAERAAYISANYTEADKALIGSPKTSFRFSSDSQIAEAFLAIKPTFDSRLNSFLGGVAPSDSNERIALFSMTYQGNMGVAIRTPLIAALSLANKNDARAEAWYDVRYLAPNTRQGWRSYMEAAMFGLYTSGQAMSEDVARATYRMYTRHSQAMVAFESAHTADLAQANAKLAGLATADSLVASLHDAESFLVAKYGAGNSFSELNVFVAEEAGSSINKSNVNVSTLIVGGSANDTLMGGRGDDVIAGGGGKNTLQGGAGNDKYIHSSSAEADTIVDSDGRGSVLTQDSNGTTQQLQGGEGTASLYTWVGAASGEQYKFDPSSSGSHIGTLTITGGTVGAGPIVINNFDLNRAQTDPSGYLGIKFKEKVAVAAGTNHNSDPFSNGIYSLSDVAAAAEGMLQTLTLYASATSATAQQITLALLGDSSLFKILSGTSLLDFSAGALTVTIPPGADSVSLGLVYTGTSAGATAQLTAALVNPDAEDTATPSNTFTVSFSPSANSSTVVDLSTQAGALAYTQLDPNQDVRIDNARHDNFGTTLIQGQNGNDIIVGGDVPLPLLTALHGGAGNDRLYAGAELSLGDAIAQGESDVPRGNSQLLLSGGGGDDQLIGGAGNDVMFGGDGSDTIVGGAGNDIIFGDGDIGDVGMFTGSSSDGSWISGAVDVSTGQVPGFNFTTRLGSYTGQRDSVGGTIETTLYRSFLLNPLVSTDFSSLMSLSGDDIAAAEPGHQNYVGFSQYHSGALSTNAGTGDDLIYAGAGDDVVNAGRGNDIVYGGTGNDIVAGYQGDDFIDGGDGDDILYGDYLSSANGPSTVTTTVYGHEVSTTNTLDPSQHGSDTLIGGAGNDQIFGGGGSDYILGGDGNDIIFGDDVVAIGAYAGNDYIDAGSGDDRVIAGGGNDYILGGDGNDYLVGDSQYEVASYQGNDYLDGGAGNDELRGGGGSDTLLGGDGNDILIGDANETGDAILTANNDDYLDGGAGDDYLDGQLGNDTLLGGTGNDVLHGGIGNDILDGGDGDDTLYGDDGDDTLYASEGNDLLAGGSGMDRYVFADGTAQSEVQDGVLQIHTVIDDSDTDSRIEFDASVDPATIQASVTPDGQLVVQFGTDGAFALRQGPDALGSVAFADGTVLSRGDFLNNYLSTALDISGSNQVLDGSAVADRLVATGGATVSGGKGDDLINLSGAGNTVVYQVGDGADLIQPAGGQYAIKFGSNLTANDLVVAVDGDALVLTFQDQGGDSLRIAGAASRAELRPTMLQFGDGSSASFDTFLSSYRQVLTGSDGDDTLIANTQLAFGYDIQGGAGSDYLQGGNLADTLSGGEGDDYLDGGQGDDVLIGGTGNDWLSDRYGANIFQFSAGDGSDQIAAISAASILKFDATVVASAASFSLEPSTNGWDLIVNYGNGDSVRVANGVMLLDGKTPTTTFSGIQFGDGTLLTSSDILARMQGVQGQATAGSDTLIGGGTDDLLDGGTGGDTLIGGAGSDTYRIHAGAGIDTIIDSGTDQESIQFVDGVQATDLIVRQVGIDLYIGTKDRATGALIRDYFANTQKTWNVTASGVAFDLQGALAAPVTEVERLRQAFEDRQFFDMKKRLADYGGVDGYERSQISGRQPGWQYSGHPGVVNGLVVLEDRSLDEAVANPTGSEAYADKGTTEITTSGVSTYADIRYVQVRDGPMRSPSTMVRPVIRSPQAQALSGRPIRMVRAI